MGVCCQPAHSSFFFAWLQMFSPPHCTLGWFFPILQSLGCHIAFVVNFWILRGSTFFVTFMLGRRQPCMTLCWMLSQSLQKMWGFMFCKSKPMSLCSTLFCNLCAIELTFYYQLMVSTHWQMLSSLTPLELIWFCGLFFFMGLLQQSRLQQRMIFIAIGFWWICFSLQP